MAKPRFQPPRGMKDIEVEEEAKRKWIFATVRQVCDAWGFREVEPTPIEYFETLAAKAGVDIDQEIYSFDDKAGRKLGLRFDLTLGLARMIAIGSFPMPQKFYTIAPMWRYDAPQYGRYRCFWQWNIEIFGSSQIQADVETIVATAEIFKNLGFSDFEIRLNNRKLVEGILNWLGIKNKKQLEDVMRVIDKIEKQTGLQLLKEFARCGIERVQAEEILAALSRRGAPEKVLGGIKKDFPASARTYPKIKEGLKELVFLVEALKQFDVLEKCVLDLSTVRGLTYYTGIVFEVYDVKNERLGALAAGGRYDNLVGIYGKNVPAVGCAGGIERIILALEKNKLFPKISIPPEFYVVAVDRKILPETQKIVAQLRAKGLSADADLLGRSLSAQMAYAAKIKVPKALIVGPKELKAGKVTLRDMATGKQRLVKVKDIPAPMPPKVISLKKELAAANKQIDSLKIELERQKGKAAELLDACKKEKAAIELELDEAHEELDKVRTAEQELRKRLER